ncbi:MAG: NUDIX hydrolase [Desulfatirhabdiaceae bacterium]
MKEKRHCPYCGMLLVKKWIEGRSRLVCTVCNQTIYENPTPASCLVVLNDRRDVLLVKRNVAPKSGFWCLPGGFIEMGEHPEEAALRELREETGITGIIDRLIGVRTNPSRQYGAVLLVGYLVTRYSGTPSPGDDASETAFFQLTALPEIAFDSHEKFIRDI